MAEWHLEALRLRHSNIITPLPLPLLLPSKWHVSFCVTKLGFHNPPSLWKNSIPPPALKSFTSRNWNLHPPNSHQCCYALEGRMKLQCRRMLPIHITMSSSLSDLVVNCHIFDWFYTRKQSHWPLLTTVFQVVFHEIISSIRSFILHLLVILKRDSGEIGLCCEAYGLKLKMKEWMFKALAQ